MPSTPDISRTEKGLYRVEDYSTTGYIDRATASAHQYFVTYWQIDTATNEYSLEKVLFGWRQEDEEQMEDVTEQCVHPELYHMRDKTTFTKDNFAFHPFYNTIRKAIGRHRRAWMIHLKLMEPPVKKEKTKFIISTYNREAYILEAVETDHKIGDYRKSSILWVPWSPEREVLMHTYNKALDAVQDVKDALFAKEEKS